MQMKSKVVLVPCFDYEEEHVYTALRQGVDLLGGLDELISPEEKILLKLNLVRSAPIERAVVTHPSVVAAMARILKENGYRNVKAGDSSGFGNPLRTMYDLGFAEALSRNGARPVEFKEAVKTAFPEGIHAKEFMLSDAVVNCDCLISMAKMKTHALEHITGAVKNQYGCIHGKNKAKGHTVYPSAESFGRMLIDLNRCVNPRLFVMDGIMAMEGNGPTSGDPTPMNVLLLSTDPVAVDTVFSYLVYLDPEVVPTNVYGQQMGLGTCKPEKIQVITPDGEMSLTDVQKRYGNPDFDVVRKRQKSKGVMGFVDIFQIFRKRPYIIEDQCKRCGICVESCPVEGKALNFKNGRNKPPVYDYKKCIRCFCCQEMCPHKAIQVKGH
ncbi:MAG: DUF362 domain-containing protein [Lachnospiraceae bacterium]|nr:DUF362 domain-containing protein [Lachnospiraceae bacterium]